jgi:CheY-like chemotaxis protein
LLWVDNQIGKFGPHIDNLRECGFRVTAVASAEEAISTIRSRATFDVIMVDLKMPKEDGIELLRRIKEEGHDSGKTKIIVLSSFLYEKVIRGRLVDLNMNVVLLEKVGGGPERKNESLAERVLAKVTRDDAAQPAKEEFSRWDKMAKSLDPFEISYEGYLESPMLVRRQLDSEARAATKKARTRLAKDGVVWVLFCGSAKEPSQTATDISEIPSDEEIFALASGRGHPPYEFFDQGEFEELEGTVADPGGASGGKGGCTDYPFFKLRVMHQHEDDVSFNRSRDFHFDSGLDVTAFSLETALEFGLDVDYARPAKFITYREKEHAFYPTSGEAVVERGDRGTLSIQISGRAYLEWEEAPFSRRCRDFRCTAGEMCFRRHALLGRNLLVENELQLDIRDIRG